MQSQKYAPALVLYFVLLGMPASGQLLPPILVSPDTSGYNQPNVAIDSANGVKFVYEFGDDVFFTNSPVSTPLNVTQSAELESDPSLAPGPVFSTDIVYVRESLSGNLDIAMLSNPGGPFLPPVLLPTPPTPTPLSLYPPMFDTVVFVDHHSHAKHHYYKLKLLTT